MGLCLTVASAGIALGAYESALAHGGRFWHAAHDRNGMAGTGCTLDATESAPRPCVFGDTSAAAAIALFGDSHAAQWFSALDSVARVRGLRLVTMTKYGCAVSRIANYDRKLKRRFDECERWREASIRHIVALRPSVLVVAQYSAQDVVRVLPVDESESPLASSWGEGLRSSLQTFDSAGVTTLLIGDTPAPHRVIPSCLSRAQHRGRPASVCDVPRSRAVDTLARRAEVEGVAGLPNVHLHDLTDHVCAATTCAATRGDTVVYLDDNHLTDAFVRGLTPTIDSAVTSVLARKGS
jgi:CTP:molybdopterin cytidylyltransferase MocA